jgi:hypothetical protein
MGKFAIVGLLRQKARLANRYFRWCPVVVKRILLMNKPVVQEQIRPERSAQDDSCPRTMVERRPQEPGVVTGAFRPIRIHGFGNHHEGGQIRTRAEQCADD